MVGPQRLVTTALFLSISQFGFWIVGVGAFLSLLICQTSHACVRVLRQLGMWLQCIQCIFMMLHAVSASWLFRSFYLYFEESNTKYILLLEELASLS